MSPDLFIEDIIYVIDTSALIDLENIFKYNNPVFKAIWEEIENLIIKDNLITLNFVEDEINSYEGDREFLREWIKNWKKKKKFIKATDETVINEAIPIINQEYNTGFLNKNKLANGKDEADPYLIAYCKKNKYVLITNESKYKPNRIPAVANKNGVSNINIYEFFEARGLKMVRKNE
jgi:hypothetical protein